MVASETGPLLCQGLDTSGGTSFVQERLALQGKTLFLVSFAFWIFLVASFVLIGGAPFVSVMQAPATLAHLAASSLMGLLWLVARGRPLALATIGALDAVVFVVACGCLAGMTVTDEGQILQTLLAITVTVMIRAILVPSTPRRTLILTTLAFVPTIIVCLAAHGAAHWLPGFTHGFQKLHMSLNTVLWSALGVTLATVTSRVTYGLRQQVAAATEIGQYILEEKIGSGGMGEIWRARHRMLIRPAAIKLIRRQALGSMPSDPELVMRRFEREARATAALTSPHTVQLYDFGATDDGTLYYVMELLDGFDLDTLVRRDGPLPAERAIHLLVQVCSSLADAHRNGLVHRDIKPANIVVSRVGTELDFAKVLDFGLVKLEGARPADAEAAKLTAAGSISGTPAFMAPEVVLGAADTDHRVDLYSLGCVAYWLLTGKLLFAATSAMKMMLDHAHAEPPRPSRNVELPIPAALDDLVMECLEKDPGRRPASAEILAARLAAISVTAWTPERAEAWWAAHLPKPAAARPLADILLSQEGRPIRIGPRAPRS